MVNWYTNLKKNIGMTDFSDQFRKIIILYKRLSYDLNVCMLSD